jgi:hypothetical protein
MYQCFLHFRIFVSGKSIGETVKSFFVFKINPANHHPIVYRMKLLTLRSLLLICCIKVCCGISCVNYQTGKLRSSRVACNTQTADGYYWKITDRVGEYGFYGFCSSKSYPKCDSTTVGTAGNTYSWLGDPQTDAWYPISTDYCRGQNAGGTCGCPVDGPTYSCSSSDSAFCGKFLAICTKIPDGASDSPSLPPSLVPTTITPTLTRVPSRVPTTPTVIPTITRLPSFLSSSSPIQPTALPSVSSGMSCAVYQTGKLRSSRVACNSATADGFYWKITDRVGEYGLFGLCSSKSYPKCDSTTVGATGRTYSWQGDPQTDAWYPISTDYCRGQNAGGTCGCPIDGETFSCASSETAFCGEFLAECSRIPEESPSFIPTVIPTATITHNPVTEHPSIVPTTVPTVTRSLTLKPSPSPTTSRFPTSHSPTIKPSRSLQPTRVPTLLTIIFNQVCLLYTIFFFPVFPSLIFAFHRIFLELPMWNFTEISFHCIVWC